MSFIFRPGGGSVAETGTISGTGNTGYLPKWASASTQNDSNIFQSGTGSQANIGIGTDNLQYQFTVNQNTLTASGAVTPNIIMRLIGATGSQTRVVIDSTQQNAYYSGRRSQGTINAPTAVEAGNVLVGLHAAGHNGSTYTNNNAIIELSADTNGGTWTQTSTPTMFTVRTTLSGGTGTTERLRINASGNVGLSTTTPEMRLHVAGSAKIDNDLYVGGVGSFTGSIFASAGSFTNLASTTSISGNSINLAGVLSGLDAKLTGSLLLGGAISASGTLTIGTAGGGIAPRQGIWINNNGYGVPGSFNQDSNGDKIVLFNNVDTEARIGFGIIDTLWMKSMGTTGSYALGIHAAKADSGDPNRVFTILKNGVVFIGGSQTPDALLLVSGGTVANSLIVHASGLANALMVASGGLVGLGTNSPVGRLTVNSNTVAGSAFNPVGDLHVIAADGVAPTILLDAAAGTPALQSRRSAGTIATPTATTAGAILLNVAAGGYLGSVYSASLANIFLQSDSLGGTWTNTSAPTQMTFYTTASGAVARTERMRITGSGFVGINTTAPASRLSVLGSVLINNGTLALSGNVNYDPLIIDGVSQAGALYVSGNGTVGIGTSTPTGPARLKNQIVARTSAFTDSNGATWQDLAIVNPTSGINAAVGLSFQVNPIYENNAGVGLGAVKAFSGADYGADMFFITRPEASASVERMRITNTGNVGIGNTAPSVRLDVTGSVNITNNLTVGGVGSFTGSIFTSNVNLTGSLALSGVSRPNWYSNYGLYPTLTGQRWVNGYVSGAPIGVTDIYTVPANKTALLGRAISYNNAGASTGSVEAFFAIKSGGNYYQVTGSTIYTSGTQTNTVLDFFLHSGESLAISGALASGLNVTAGIIEFDSNVPLYRKGSLELVSGNNTLYTVPAGKSAQILDSNLGFTFVSVVHYGNYGGAASLYSINLVPSGGTVGENNKFIVPTNLNAQAARVLIPAGFGLNSGDYVNLAITMGSSTQVGFVNVMEV